MKDQVHVAAVIIPALAAIMTAAAIAALARFASVTTALRFTVLAAAWWIATGALAAAGVLARFDARPPPIAPFMASVLIAGIALGCAPAARRLAEGAPLWLLVGAQAFRLPLELAMHQAAVDGVMPVELSFSGYNFDIVTGAGAVVVAALLWRGARARALVWAWNVVGIAALTMIVAIAILTSPMVHAFGSEPAHLNTWVTAVPYVWLPAVLVVLAVAGHVVVTRALLITARRASSA